MLSSAILIVAGLFSLTGYVFLLKQGYRKYISSTSILLIIALNAVLITLGLVGTRPSVAGFIFLAIFAVGTWVVALIELRNKRAEARILKRF